MVDYSHQTSQQRIEESSYVSLPSADGHRRVVRKTTLCWFLENPTRKLSNDRTLRVMQSGSCTEKRRVEVSKLEQRKVLVGDWCLFWTGEDKTSFHAGRVLSFALLSRANKSPSIWEWDLNNINSDNVGALCVWYDLERHYNNEITGNLVPLQLNSVGFHPCKLYMCSVPSPRIDESQLCFLQNTVNQLKVFLNEHVTK